MGGNPADVLKGFKPQTWSSTVGTKPLGLVLEVGSQIGLPAGQSPGEV